MEDDRLSKDDMELQEGTWEIKEFQQGQISSYFHEYWL
jgi:hypothetical protein